MYSRAQYKFDFITEQVIISFFNFDINISLVLSLALLVGRHHILLGISTKRGLSR
jgi:hypothetical protein